MTAVPSDVMQDARVELQGTTKGALEAGKNRLLVVGALFALAFSAIALRTVEVMVLKPGQPRAHGAQMAGAPPNRGEIRDRNGELLATSLATASVYADPSLIRDPDAAARKIVQVLPELNEAELRAKLASDKRFVWIDRNLTPRQQYAVNRLGIPGLAFEREARRVYPQGSLVAHVVGFAGVDNRGLAGIERFFDQSLIAGEAPIALSLDIRVQHAMHEELSAAVQSFNAIGAVGMVMDVRTGELLALVSLPDFDPNHPGSAPPESRFNRATLGTYEMGSTFKIFTVAGALDAGTTTMKGGYDATHPIKIGRFSIEDYHAKKRFLTTPEIFVHSSNIGAAKMALDMGVSAHRAFLESLGFTAPARIELPEIGAPIWPRAWREVNTMTIAFGHGMAVSPLQIVTATAAMVNGGVLHTSTLLRRETLDENAPRVISPQTSAEMRKLMRMVVEQGTGKSADVPGYRVGGKTGTAEKNGVGGYKKKALLSSFIGVFPIDEPRYAIAVMIDEPKGNKETYGYATGGWVAAPVVGRLVRRVGPLLGVEPVEDPAPEQKQKKDMVVTANTGARPRMGAAAPTLAGMDAAAPTLAGMDAAAPPLRIAAPLGIAAPPGISTPTGISTLAAY